MPLSSLSPLLGAFCLLDLDQRLEKLPVTYFRYRDDVLIVAPTRWKLREAIRVLNEAFGELKLEKHPDKTFIGRIEKGFDFLRYHFSPYGLSLAKRRRRSVVRVRSGFMSTSRGSLSAPPAWIVRAAVGKVGKCRHHTTWQSEGLQARGALAAAITAGLLAVYGGRTEGPRLKQALANMGAPDCCYSRCNPIAPGGKCRTHAGQFKSKLQKVRREPRHANQAPRLSIIL